MDHEQARDRMVDRLASRRELSEQVFDAMRAVPRHEFVPEERRGSAYEDRPLPIGEGQTISAPHMVAVMCDLLDLDAGDRVLEIGTGCGYHAAVTAELVGDRNVYSVEYHPDLAAAASDTLAALGYDVEVRAGDGHDGWPEHAPYDACYLTCATPSVPDDPLDQLREGGQLLAPVGERHQTLVELERTASGVRRDDHGGVRFVPMRGG